MSKDDIDKAAQALLAMRSPAKEPRPSRPNSKDANRLFRLRLRKGQPKIEELPE